MVLSVHLANERKEAPEEGRNRNDQCSTCVEQTLVIGREEDYYQQQKEDELRPGDPIDQVLDEVMNLRLLLRFLPSLKDADAVGIFRAWKKIQRDDIGRFQYDEAKDYDSDHIHWAAILCCHIEEHRAEIGDEPDKPDGDAELMEVHDHFFILPDQHHCRPYGMDEHENDGNQP